MKSNKTILLEFAVLYLREVSTLERSLYWKDADITKVSILECIYIREVSILKRCLIGEKSILERCLLRRSVFIRGLDIREVSIL